MRPRALHASGIRAKELALEANIVLYSILIDRVRMRAATTVVLVLVVVLPAIDLALALLWQ